MENKQISFFTHEFGNYEIRVVGDGRLSIYDVLVAFLEPRVRKGQKKGQQSILGNCLKPCLKETLKLSIFVTTSNSLAEGKEICIDVASKVRQVLNI